MRITAIIQKDMKLLIKKPMSLLAIIFLPLVLVFVLSFLAKEFFAYLVSMLITLSSMMLAAKLVFENKKSKAFVRESLSTTDDIYFVLGHLFTVTFIVALEVLILFFAGYLLSDLSFAAANYLALMAIAVFALLGMTIAYLAYSEENAMVSSIIFSSLLFVFSDIVFHAGGFFYALVKINPFVITETLISLSLDETALYLVAYVFVLLIFVYAARKKNKARHF